MEWYKLVFEQIQPVHIGKFNWGVVSETEIFIPGQTMWGALVNAYLQKNKLSSSIEIETIQKKFEIITNFFPSFDGKNILEPAYKKGEFIYKINGNIITEEEFRLYFVSADFKTAIDPFTTTAKEERLYEFEYILPGAKKEFQEKEKIKKLKGLDFNGKVYWIGLIKIEEEIESFLKKDRLKIFIGGDTRYGFGELELIKLKEIDKETNNNELKEWNVDKDGRFVKSRKDDNGNKGLRNYFQFFRNDLKFKGELILLPEFNFTQNVPLVEKAEFFITPGSLIKGNSFNGKSLNLKKGKFQQS